MHDDISKRKQDHIKITLEKPVRFESRTAGFDMWDFDHYALPESDYDDVDTTTEFLGHPLSFPFMIACMTSGLKDGELMNKALARVANKCGVAMGLGSLRPVVQEPQLLSDYEKIRKICTDIPLIGNVGGVNLFREISQEVIERVITKLRPDALAVHLNPLQEIIQPEGDTNFSGVLQNIKRLVELVPIPVIVKETGAGISGKNATLLKNAGISIVDVAGAGGTSWSAVESIRAGSEEEDRIFREWGIPTAICIEECTTIKNLTVIASGGISDGMKLAKSLALGAGLCSAAYPVLKAFDKDGESGVEKLIVSWQTQLKRIMFLTGSANIHELDKSKLRRKI